ncbi:putative traNSPOSABLE ELEMENT-RELATED, partial [Phytophthora infestans]
KSLHQCLQTDICASSLTAQVGTDIVQSAKGSVRLIFTFLSAKHHKQRLAYAKKCTAPQAGFLCDIERTKRMLQTVRPTFKSRKPVMVWSSICGNGVSPLHVCETSVNGEYYREILITNDRNGLPNQTLFVQDNVPAHTATKTIMVLIGLNLMALTHPARSPYMNPIENIGAILKWELNKTPATSSKI